MSTVRKIKSLYPGLAICLLCTVVAFTMANQYAIPLMLAALLIGLALNSLFAASTLQPGIAFGAHNVLYGAVAILGIKIDFHHFAGAGLTGALIALATLILTGLLGLVICRLLGIDKPLAALISGAVAVCGVSAAAAISCVLPERENRDRDLMLVIAGVTVLSTIAMIFYPMIALWTGMNEREAGTFFGATIHNVSQVVGAGYTISGPTGDFATFVKLVRVSALILVVLSIGYMFAKSDPKTQRRARDYFPPFIIIFFALALLRTFADLPAQIVDLGSQLAELGLVFSLAAIGIKTKMTDIVAVGPRPLIAMISISGLMIIIAMLAIFGISYFGIATL